MRLQRRQALHWSLGLATLPLGAPAEATALAWRERALQGFGTTLWLRAAHAQGERADQALDAAVAQLRHLERQMSLFDPASALSRLNRDGVLADPDPALLDVLRLARRVSERSQGALDVTIQPLWAAWWRARAEGRRPTPAELAAARALVDWRAVDLSPHRIRLRRPGMAITLNGMAQGYAADRTKALLQRHGVQAALLDTGEWASLGAAPDGQPWRLGLASPRDSRRILATLHGDGRGVAVSTDAQLRFGPDPVDDRAHHILDPRTGHSPQHLSAVAVVAPTTTLADALTKVMFMGTADEALQQARRWGVDVVVVDKAGRVAASDARWLEPRAAAKTHQG